MQRGTRLPWLRIVALVGLPLASARPADAQQIRALITPTAGIPATAPVPPRVLTAEDVHAGTLRVGPVRFDPAFLAEVRRAFTGSMEAPPRTITVSPFPDVTFTLVLRRSIDATAASNELTVLSGEVQQIRQAGIPADLQARPGAQGTFTMVLYESELTLSIFSPAGNYHIRRGLDGRREAIQEDPAAPVQCGDLRTDRVAGPRAGSPAVAASGSTATGVDDRSEIVVLVLYTDDAISTLGGDEAGLQAEISKGVELTNAAFRSSGVGITTRLAGGRALHVPATFRPSAGFDGDLSSLQTNAQVAELRAQHKADVVTLARGRGDAWSVAGATTAAARGAYGVVYARKFADGLVFAHGLGHHLGAGHNPENVDARGQHPYSHGWHGAIGEDTRRATHVGTIMSYVGQRIPYFSTPRVQYQGVTIGSERQDNARTFNQSRATVAAHQE